MATVLDAYEELVATIATWTARTDLTSVIPTFILLTEERINRLLRVRQMEVALAETTITSNRIAVPANTVAIKTVWVTGYEHSPLSMRPYDQVIQLGTDGVPTSMAWQGDYLYFDGTGSVAGVLYEKVTPITTTGDTNWLLETYPSAYLFGALSEAFAYLQDDMLAAKWNARFEQTLRDIANASQRDTLSGRLMVRAR